jgi:phage/plasmid-associated DNA primase
MASDLFNVYRQWAKQNNEYEMSSKKFFMEVQKKLPEKGRSGKGIFYGKIRFTDYAKGLVPKQYRSEDFING